MKTFRLATEGAGMNTSLPPTDRMLNIAEKLSKVHISKGAATVIALALSLIAACGDAFTHVATTFTLFYVAAILLAVWFAGQRSGYWVALTTVVARTLGSMYTIPELSLESLIWNFSVDGVLFVSFAQITWALKQRLYYEVLARHDAVGQLRQAERLSTVGRLASGIAHEIGTPLNVISGRAELIASGSLSKEDVIASANIVIGQAERVSVIIRQLLDFARRGGTRAECVNLAELAEETAKILRPLAGKLGVDIVCSGERARATVNPGEIQQVITNLVTNAIYALPDGGKVEILVSSRTESDPRDPHALPRTHAVLSVRDHGVGIAPDVLPRIFEPFFTTRDVGVGTGLGLSVAYGIVQDHGGWMSVDTRLGEGTTVTLHLPTKSPEPRVNSR